MNAMKVLVLGGSGYVGARLCRMLKASGWALPIPASSRANGAQMLRLDARDETAMTAALKEVDAVVNCVAGNPSAIAEGAAVLARAAAAAGCMRVVHFSTMSVYGAQEGVVTENAELDPHLGWYGKAKVEAEARIARLCEHAASVTVLRPGCVYGPGSELWVGRVARWLAAHRLGDLGAAGDGWSNLVHVDDVCQAVMQSLQRPQHPGRMRVYNLAAPDSPRWNDYFCDLALATGATPLRRIRPQQLKFDACVAGPALHVARKLLTRMKRDASWLPDPISPGLLGLWSRHLKLDSSAAQRDFSLQWTPYEKAVQQCAQWVLSGGDVPAPTMMASKEST